MTISRIYKCAMATLLTLFVFCLLFCQPNLILVGNYIDMTMGVSSYSTLFLNIWVPLLFSSIVRIESQWPFIVPGLKLIHNCTKQCFRMQDVELDAKVKSELQNWSEQDPTSSESNQSFFQEVSRN